MSIAAKTQDQEPMGVVWLDCPSPVVSVGLEKALLGMGARIRRGEDAEGASPALVVACPSEGEDIAERVARFAARSGGAPVVVLGLSADLRLARRALLAGARGFVHAQMPPERVAKALAEAKRGEVVIAEDLLQDLADGESTLSDLDGLTSRQHEILELVSEGLSNAEIAGRLYLSESTVKQHLTRAFKVLDVGRRIQAAEIFRRAASGPGKRSVG